MCACCRWPGAEFRRRDPEERRFQAPHTNLIGMKSTVQYSTVMRQVGWKGSVCRSPSGMLLKLAPISRPDQCRGWREPPQVHQVCVASPGKYRFVNKYSSRVCHTMLLLTNTTSLTVPFCTVCSSGEPVFTLVPTMVTLVFTVLHTVDV